MARWQHGCSARCAIIGMEFSLRVRGELSDRSSSRRFSRACSTAAARCGCALLEPAGGEGSNRWYRLVATGASGNEIRQLIERQAATLVRLLRTRIGALTLPRTLPRGHWQELSPAELAAVTGSAGACWQSRLWPLMPRLAALSNHR